MRKKILVTGGAGFIGSHLIEHLLRLNFSVIIVDNYDDFYDRSVKETNIQSFKENKNVDFIECSIENYEILKEKLSSFTFDAIIHLAAKAGVRPSIQNPIAYQITNVNGTQNLLEIAKDKGVSQFIFASSSSVYGINSNFPWSENDYVLKPISPYASTKISGELLGHVYAHLYSIRFIALRFFTVYGPRQRPDLAIHKFSSLIYGNKPVPMYGDGSSRRDYTYVDDIIKGIIAAIDYDKSLYEIINLGNFRTISLLEMIETLENIFDMKAQIQKLPEQPGDVPVTFADITKAKELLGYIPQTSFDDGVTKFKEWYLNSLLSPPVLT